MITLRDSIEIRANANEVFAKPVEYMSNRNPISRGIRNMWTFAGSRESQYEWAQFCTLRNVSRGICIS